MATIVDTAALDNDSSSLVTWLQANRRLATIAGALVLLGGAAIWFTLESGKRKEAYAAAQLNQARTSAEAGNLPLAASEFQRLIDGYGGTQAGKEAVIALNQVRLINGQNELAVVGLTQFLQSNPPTAFVGPAYGLLGAAFENSGRPKDAGEAYLNAARHVTLDYLKAQHLVSAGRAFANAGAVAEATAALTEVKEKYQDTPLATEAQVRLAELTPKTASAAP